MDKSKFITPVIAAGAWRTDIQVRAGVKLTDGRIVARGIKANRDSNNIRRANYYKPGMPIAVVEVS